MGLFPREGRKPPYRWRYGIIHAMKTNMKLKTRRTPSLPVAAALALCINLSSAFAAESKVPPERYPKQNPARVDEIAAMLPEKPGTPAPRPSDRAAWAAVANAPGAAKIIAKAEGLCGEPIPELPDELYLEFRRNGNRSRYQEPFFRRLHAFDLMMLAEALEWKGRFVPEIRRRLESILAEKAWTLPAHDSKLDCFEGRKPLVKLFSSQRAWVVAYAIDWFGEVLPADLVARAKAECRRRILEPYLTACRDTAQVMPSGCSWFFGPANWTSVCHAGCVGLSLIISDDRRERAECIEAAERAMPFYLDGFSDDGYCSEGAGYWNYGFGHYIALLAMVQQATGGAVKLGSDTPKAALAAAYAVNCRLDNGISPPFADGSGDIEMSHLEMARRFWPDAIPETYASFPLLEGRASNYGDNPPCHIVAMRAFFKPTGSQAPRASKPQSFHLPPLTEFGSAQVYISRPGYGKDGMSLALKGGHNSEFHNHNDVGTYAIALDGELLAGDVGGETYTARTFSARRYDGDVLNSFGHPVPRIGGGLQPRGREFAAKVLRTTFKTEKDMVELDLKGAYSCPALKRLVRRFTHHRSRGTVTVRDEVEFSEPIAFDVPVTTIVRAEKTADGLVLAGKRAKMSVKVAATGGDWTWDEYRLDNGGKNGTRPIRLSVTFTKPVTNATVEFTFTPWRLTPEGSSPGKTVKVSDFGYDAADSTRFIQQALDSGAGKVILDRQKGPWVTLPLFGRSNTELVVEPGVELLAKRGEFRGKRDYLFTLNGITNFTLRGGEGSTFRMWKCDYQKPPYDRSEWRYTLRIVDSRDVRVENMRFVESGGDGIVIGGSKGVTIRNCLCDRNHRQGISLCSGEDVLIENTVMRATSGTPPQAGIDLEPDGPSERLVNCTLRNCLVENNAGSGYEIYLNALNESSAPVSITFESCRSVGNRSSASVCGGNGRTEKFVKGFVRFVNCTFEGARGSGISVTSKPAKAFDVSFKDCVVSNAAGRDVSFGVGRFRQGVPDGIRLENLTVFQPTNRPWFTYGSQGLGPMPRAVSGGVRVVKPDGKLEAETLDATWVARNMPPVNGGRPAPPHIGVPDAARVAVRDACPGEMVELAPITRINGSRFIMFADRPGMVRLVARQVIAVKGRPADTKPIEIRAVGKDGRLGRTWKFPAAGTKPTEIAFKAPKRGFYALIVPKGGTRFRIDRSSVPIAMDVSERECTVAPMGGKPFSLWFDFAGGNPFALLAGGGSYYRFKVAVSDPDGNRFAGSDLVESLYFANAGADAKPGLWRADFSRAKKPCYDFIHLDIYGAAPFFFLSKEKTWTAK